LWNRTTIENIYQYLLNRASTTKRDYPKKREYFQYFLMMHLLNYKSSVSVDDHRVPSTQLQVPWFAQNMMGEDQEIYLGELSIKKVSKPVVQQELQLPRDPRHWSRADVCSWVCWMCSVHGLPSPKVDRFLMNGKAVCLMSVSMFTSRVPLGGKLLYKDFQLRLASATHAL